MSLAKIGNKIFDKNVELSKEQVDLNIVKDLASAVNKIRNAVGEGNRVHDNMYDRRNKVEDALDDIDMLKGDFRQSDGAIANIGGELQDLLKLSDKLESSAKELGINPMEIKGVKEALEYQKKGSDLMKELKAEQKRTESTLKKL